MNNDDQKIKDGLSFRFDFACLYRSHITKDNDLKRFDALQAKCCWLLAHYDAKKLSSFISRMEGILRRYKQKNPP